MNTDRIVETITPAVNINNTKQPSATERTMPMNTDRIVEAMTNGTPVTNINNTKQPSAAERTMPMNTDRIVEAIINGTTTVNINNSRQPSAAERTVNMNTNPTETETTTETTTNEQGKETLEMDTKITESVNNETTTIQGKEDHTMDLDRIFKEMDENAKREAKARRQMLDAEELKELNRSMPKFGTEYLLCGSQNEATLFCFINAYMTTVEPGTFTMAKRDGCNDEREIEHRVTITEPFKIARVPVTREFYKSIMGTDPSVDCHTCPDAEWGDNLPVNRVSYNDALAFVQKLNEKYGKYLSEGWEFALPTEAQWEYAAQGGHERQADTKFAGSDNFLDVAYPRGKFCHFVAQNKPNDLGLYDMCGNIRQWCQDCCLGDEDAQQAHRAAGIKKAFEESQAKGIPCTQKLITEHIIDEESDSVFDYTPKTYVDGITDPMERTGSERVLRGGDFEDCEENCRIAARASALPDCVDEHNGIRLVLVKKA